MCAPVQIIKHCGNCLRKSKRLDDDNGHCRQCNANRKPGNYFPGYQPPQEDKP